MKNQIVLLVFTLIFSSGYAQNLVPNGNFDETVECPFGNALLEGYCASWFRSQFDPDVLPSNIPSPDFYHSCGLNDAIVPPAVFTGYQEAFDGRGFVGVATYDALNTNAREIVGSQLIEPMVVGVEYYVSFRIVAGGPNPNLINLYSNGIGVKFSTVSTWNNPPELINNEAHYAIQEVVTDTVNWELHEFVFTADSAYEYIHLGNFYRDWLTDTVHIAPPNRAAYYFLDDVRVSTDPLSTSSGDGLFLTLSPNPVHDILDVNCSGSREIREVEILSVSGVKVFREGNRSRRLRLNIKNLSEGIYLVKIVLNDGATLVKRIIKI